MRFKGDISSMDTVGNGLNRVSLEGAMSVGVFNFRKKQAKIALPKEEIAATFARLPKLTSIFLGSDAQPIRRPTIIRKINDNLYVANRAQDRDLSFVMTRLTDENLAVWWNLHKRGSRLTNLDLCNLLEQVWDESWSEKQKKFILDIEAGAMAFRSTLEMYEQSQGKPCRPEVWISYALSGTNIDPTQPMQEKLFEHVEMVVTALTQPGAPFVVHMGIGRTIYNMKKVYDNALPEHKNLSITLHAFTAKAIVSTPQGADKIWLLTHPAASMAAIFRKHLPEGSFRTARSIWDSDMPISYNENGSLCVKNPEGEVVANFTQQDFDSWKMNFLQHPQMGPPMPAYAVSYQFLADSMG